jgi:hypothetical protein
MRDLHVKPRLPNWSYTYGMTHGSFICAYDSGNSRRMHYTKKNVNVIWHDDESKEKERIESLYSIDGIYCFSGICCILK